MLRWVLIRKAVEILGYSEDAIRCKIKKGVWVCGIHWRKAPDGRIFLHLGEIEKWIEGKGA